MAAKSSSRLKYLALTGGIGLLASLPAAADLYVSAHVPGLCLGKSGGNAALERCSPQSDLGFSGYGQIRRDGMCLSTQHEGDAAKSPRGYQLVWESCANAPRQQWGFKDSGRWRGALNNEEGWCANIRGAARNEGASIIAWTCEGGTNEKWQPGTWKSNFFTSGTQARYKGQILTLDQLASDALSRPGMTGANVVAHGGMNVVAMGGANVVAMGGANVVAMGGANLINPGNINPGLINPGNINPGLINPGNINPGVVPPANPGRSSQYRAEPVPTLPAKVVFSSPAYNQKLTAGDSLKIAWRNEGGAAVGGTLALVSENVEVAGLGEARVAGDSRSWTLPANTKRGVYRVVMKVDGKEVGNSGDFFVEPKATNDVPLGISHTANRPVRAGDKVTLNWRSEGYVGDAMARLHLRTMQGDIVMGLPYGDPKGGTLDWSIPPASEVPPGTYRFTFTLPAESGPAKIVNSNPLVVIPK